MCKKHTYSSKSVAEIDAKRILNEIGHLLDSYKCNKCPYWHLTSKRIKKPIVFMRIGEYYFSIKALNHCIIAKIQCFKMVVCERIFSDPTDLETPFIWGYDWFEENLSGECFNAFCKVANPLFDQIQDLRVSKASI